MTQTTYYEYDSIPCQVHQESAMGAASAEGYFPGKGFCPIAVTSVLFHGTPITEKEFRALVVANWGN